MEISHAKAREVWGQLQSAKNRLRSLKESAEVGVGRTKQLAEGLGGALAMGFLAGRNGNVMPQLFGFDMDMVIGLGGGALAIMGVAGKYDEDILNLAIGCGGSYAFREGSLLGAKHPAGAKQAAGAIGAGHYASGAIPAQHYASGAIPANQYR